MYGDAKEFVERHFAGVDCECRVCIGTNRKRLYQATKESVEFILYVIYYTLSLFVFYLCVDG